MNSTSRRIACLFLVVCTTACASFSDRHGGAASYGCVVYQTDFGLKDGAVASMKGVARAVDPSLALMDLTHEIPPFDIWTAALRLRQTVPYWPKGTVFVSVVDPGVGTERLPIVVEDAAGHFIVTPDNGTLTLVADTVGLRSARVIDVARFHRPGANVTATFHGRDVFSYVGALLAARQVAFDDIGPPLALDKLVTLDVPKPALVKDGARVVVSGIVEGLDEPYGNVWTNIPTTLLADAGIAKGTKLSVRIAKGAQDDASLKAFDGAVPFCATFGDVAEGQPLAYSNSLDHLAFALNMGDFARTHMIGTGPKWTVTIEVAR